MPLHRVRCQSPQPRCPLHRRIAGLKRAEWLNSGPEAHYAFALSEWTNSQRKAKATAPAEQSPTHGARKSARELAQKSANTKRGLSIPHREAET